ncbi:MAG: TRAP transporter small permease [Alphaproteobacteria bacterium]
MDALMDRSYRGLRFVLDDIFGNIAAIGLLIGTLFAIYEIITRYIFGTVFQWGQDAVIYIIIGSVFMYFAVTQAKRAHLVMSAFTDLLYGRGFVRTVIFLRMCISAFSLFFFSYFAYWGLPTVERTMLTGRTSQSMFLVLWPFQAVLLGAFALMALCTVFHLYQDVRALFGKKVFEWAPAEIHTDI